ncbi:acyl-CoA synthetase [Vreelandella arcis]|uniref:Acyl-CoA synthetase (AMP-forming)/AMP-acid ligase II n=1 Tax=Vreelandella arcis TaxID=416873 RepID=A0A1H0GZ81_9GAMM|nr:acyl-CoA synthetase [Halomonas arcis]SDO12199.1 Acyl-CoA synthetase (AMP-forming)/AMP-acid ligase II [Halomonas arcis]
MSRHVQAPAGGVIPASKRVMNLAYFLTQAARRFPHGEALVMGDNILTWEELDRRVNALALALRARGVEKGDRLLVHSRNGFEMVETQLAAFRLGAIWAPANFRISPDEAVWLAELTSARVVIIGSEFEAHYKTLREASDDLKLTVRIGEGEFGDVDYESFLREYDGQSCRNTDVEHDDPCWFFFTSGTTGRSKAAVLTHGQMGFITTNHLCDLMPGTEHTTDASLVVAPLSHGSGIHYLTQLARGVKTVLPSGAGFDAEEIWALIERHNITNVFTVPTIVKMLVEDPAVNRYDHSSLRYVIYAGAPMYRADQKVALEKLGKVLVQYYGLGEVTGNITVLPPGLHSANDEDMKVGTCGYDRTAMQVSIQDEAGNELTPFESGEICVCGLGVFAGYYANPDANEKSFRNGWFLTGDLGHIDDEGCLYITGRASDMFISGGSNIYPREIEEKMLSHPDISEVAVVGMPDDQWGEIGVAAVVPGEGKTLDAETLREWVKTRVSSYKVPRRYHFFDALPKSNYGKITKKIIKQAIEEREKA